MSNATPSLWTSAAGRNAGAGIVFRSSRGVPL
jgi:hypothetical protein